MRIELYCANCYWSGFAEELVSKTDDPDDWDFSYCPACGGKEFEEEDVDDDGCL